MRTASTVTFVGLLTWLVSLLFSMAISLGLVYAAIHFIKKFW